VQLEGLAQRYPNQLSGGQRQRVALARALAIEPSVLLLDEPFGALDAKVRQDLRRWLRRLHRELHITGVLVTHDQEEALEVADRVVVMNHGKVEQVGAPNEVYDHPSNPFVYNFLGNVNLFHGRLDQGWVSIGPLTVEMPEHPTQRDAPVVGYVRPHELELQRHRNGTAAIEATVRGVHSIGPVVRVELTRNDNGDPIEVDLTRDRYRQLLVEPGDLAFVTLHNLRIFSQQAH
ncbi:MAG: TOBE-like domain-containing protein, partial [Chloroflexi bacterium]|nr:TOBE-like domain-containing protein [Chloroflexota bacterium]